MGVTFYKILSYSLFPQQQKKSFRYCGKSFSCGFSCSDARNAITKATDEYVIFGFSYRILVFFLLQEILNVTVSRQYEFFSVLAAKIFYKRLELRMVKTLPYIHQPNKVARKASDLLAADWRYQTREKCSKFFHLY